MGDANCQLLYKDKVSLKALIEEQALDCTVPYLIRIYTAIASRKEAAQLAGRCRLSFRRLRSSAAAPVESFSRISNIQIKF